MDLVRCKYPDIVPCSPLTSGASHGLASIREYAIRLEAMLDLAAFIRALFLFGLPLAYRTVRGLPRDCFFPLFFPLLEVIYLNKLTS